MKNAAFQDGASAYYSQNKDFLLDLIPDGPNVVLDLGCGAGGVGKALLDRGKASELIGVEIFESAARNARKVYKRVHVGDIEEMELLYQNYFDVVVCGDILEHLKDPSKVLVRVRSWLKNEGRIVCSVPNVRYWRVLRDLMLRGRWDYAAEGIMDNTHLRFFTTRSFKKLLRESGFEVECQRMRIAPGPKQKAANRLTFGLFEEFLGFQMLMTAYKRDGLEPCEASTTRGAARSDVAQ
jgi:SAM-dependent methyltransferase